MIPYAAVILMAIVFINPGRKFQNSKTGSKLHYSTSGVVGIFVKRRPL